MKFIVRRILISFLVVWLLPVGAAFGSLSGQINGIVSRSSLKKVTFAVHIIKADSGKKVYSRKANVAMIPASNMKIITTAAALKYLGADFKYKTRIGLQGDSLVVIGSGDPLLGDEKTEAKYGKSRHWVLDDIVAGLKEARITKVGNIIVDTTVFDDERVHPNWPKEQLNRWYACEVSGVNYNGNCVLIGAKNTGGRVVISLEPQTTFIKLINKVSARGGNVMGAYRNHTQNVLTVKGKCSKSVAPFDVAIERPAAFFGFLLAEKLNAAGITTGGKLLEQTVVNPGQIQLVREYSHTIGDCLGRSNKNSFGLVAESLLKTIAAHESASKKNGSWVGGREVISDYMKGLGIDSGQFYIDDASGLSRQNKLSARAITKVLASVYKSKDRQLYKNSLAAGGIDGTIKKYFREKKYKGKVFGKTGYIVGVKSFSGICSTAKGDYIFSILTNRANARTRPAINDIAKAIIDSN